MPTGSSGTLDGMHWGVIVEVVPPDSDKNRSGYQYEYSLDVTIANYATLPIENAVRIDEFGGVDDYNDVVLEEGQKVLILCPRGDYKNAFILGGQRAYHQKSVNDATCWIRRFNRVTQKTCKDNIFSVTSDFGPFWKLAWLTYYSTKFSWHLNSVMKCTS